VQDLLDLDNKATIPKLLAALNECNEWGQVAAQSMFIGLCTHRATSEYFELFTHKSKLVKFLLTPIIVAFAASPARKSEIDFALYGAWRALDGNGTFDEIGHEPAPESSILKIKISFLFVASNFLTTATNTAKLYRNDQNVA